MEQDILPYSEYILLHIFYDTYWVYYIPKRRFYQALLPVAGAASGVVVVVSATVGVGASVGSVVCAKVMPAAVIAETVNIPVAIATFFNICSPPFLLLSLI